MNLRRPKLFILALTAVVVLGCADTGAPQTVVVHVPPRQVQVTEWPDQSGVVPVWCAFQIKDAWASPIFRGSGTVVRKEGGKWWILTCEHVISFQSLKWVGVTGVKIYLGNGKRLCTVFRRDPLSDLAVLEIVDPGASWRPYRVSTEALAMGQKVFSLGVGLVPPLGEGDPPVYATHTQPGHVSSATVDPQIPTNCSIKGGFSGGPLLNTRGELIGVNRAANGPGYSYHIPITQAMIVEEVWTTPARPSGP